MRAGALARGEAEPATHGLIARKSDDGVGRGLGILDRHDQPSRVVTADPTKEPGARVVSVTVGGQPLDMAKTYTVATNDYMATGGDGYDAFKEGKVLIDASSAKYMASQVIDWIAAKGEIAPEIEGRIVKKN